MVDPAAVASGTATVQRASGSLFGLAYGDALGRPTEFLPVSQIEKRYGPGGPRELEGDPALVTDDTQMGLAVAWALHEAGATATPERLEPLLRQGFVAWAYSPDNDRAPGATCMSACRSLAKEELRWQEATVVASKGCGANMRVTPVGLVPGYDLDTLAGVAQLQAALTHGHPTGLAASELTAYAVRVLRDGAALTELPGLLRRRAEEQRTTYRVDWLGDLWQRAEATDPETFISEGWAECLGVLDRLDGALAWPDHGGDPCHDTGAGWVAEEALATGLLCAIRHHDDPVSALARGANTHGDSDSIACLAGAFVGAAHGMAGWPAEWSQRIEYSDQLGFLGAAWD